MLRTDTERGYHKPTFNAWLRRRKMTQVQNCVPLQQWSLMVHSNRNAIHHTPWRLERGTISTQASSPTQATKQHFWIPISAGSTASRSIFIPTNYRLFDLHSLNQQYQQTILARCFHSKSLVFDLIGLATNANLTSTTQSQQKNAIVFADALLDKHL